MISRKDTLIDLLRQKVKSALRDNEPLYQAAERLYKRARHGGFRHYCVLCNSHVRRFEDFGTPTRSAVLCPVCGSLERHRLVWNCLRNENELFDAVVANHVLEHIPEDRKAMSEILRVLKPGGWAILQVSIEGEETFEAPTITDPAVRERLFGQHDHVRKNTGETTPTVCGTWGSRSTRSHMPDNSERPLCGRSD